MEPGTGNGWPVAANGVPAMRLGGRARLAP